MPDDKSRPPSRWRFTPRAGIGLACLVWCACVLAVAPRFFPAHPSSWVVAVWLVAAVVVPWAVWIVAVAHWPTPEEQKEELKRAVSVAEHELAAEERGRFYHAHGGRCQVCERAVKASGRNWSECPHCHALVCWTCQKEVVTSAGSHLSLCPVCDDMIAVTEVPTSDADSLRQTELCHEAEKRVVCCAGCGAWDEQTEPQPDLADVTMEAAEAAFGAIPKPALRMGKLWLCPRCLAARIAQLRAARDERGA